jgi:DNA repair protein RadC
MDGQTSQSERTAYRVEPDAWRVRDLPARLRPREAMARLGAANVNDDVLLAVLLRSGVPGLNVVDLAGGLLRRYGSLTALAAATESELAACRGVGPVKAQILKAALEIGRRLHEERAPRRVPVRTPEDVHRLMGPLARGLDREIFWALPLNAKNMLVHRPLDISQGLLDASLVHPREVFREAIRTSAAAMIVAHNHPSGDPSPSAEDIRVTRQLVQAGRIIGIRLLDHVILADGSGGDNGFMSMREAGVVDFA